MKLKDGCLAESGKTVDQLADEIVELLLSSKNDLKKAEGETTGKKVSSGEQESRIVNQVGKLEKRIEALENRVEKYIGSFKIVATESGRSITEKTETLKRDVDSDIVGLRGELDELRTAMIRLSNEVKKMRESRF